MTRGWDMAVVVRRAADFTYIPSSMGQGPPFGLGRGGDRAVGVVVVNGDGCMLMNLGCLATW